MKFEERALNFDYKLTELEDDLVDYILKNKEAAARSKITVLAKEFYSAPNTITRFCHKLGYEGFTDLKASLKWELDQEKEIKNADLVITGEGKMDNQTAHGKVPYGMAKLAREHGVPTLAFCGTLNEDLGETEELLLAAFSIQQSPLSLEEAMDKAQTCKNIKQLVKNVIRTLNYKEMR